jgi:hypothetical protein
MPDSPAKAPSIPMPPSTQARTAAWVEFIQRQGAAAAMRRVMSRFEKPVVCDFSRNVRPMPGQDEYQTILAQSAVSLGINRYPSFRHSAKRPGTYSRLRDLEAPMLAACYLTEWTEGLDQLYDLQSEIATYRNAEELVATARELLRDEHRRRTMREKGQRRALSEHTVARTMEKITESLGLSPTVSK